MIPKIIHYVWLGGEMPETVQRCIASWKQYMPEWVYKRWDETNFDIASAPTYVQEAYAAKKFAFVADYIRLWALEQYGGLYMDADFEVYKPFDDLMDRYVAFAGYEGSKRKPVMMGVIASEPHGAWMKDMLGTYKDRHFLLQNGSYDMTPNTSYFTDRLEKQGFVADGVEKDVIVKSEFFLHVYPVDYFCPGLTTGENIRSERTYCEHKGESSWAQKTWKARLLSLFGPKVRTWVIKGKRKIFPF